MRRVLVIVCVFSFFAAVGNAQLVPKGNVFVGYSYNRFDLGGGNHTNLNGWAGSLEGKIFPFVGIVADISGHYGTPSGVTTHEYNFLFGPRVSASIGKIRPFAHAMFGASHINTSVLGFSNSDTSLGTALGGGLDYDLLKVFAWRVQGDYLQTRFFSNTQNNFRLSTGLVFKF